MDLDWRDMDKYDSFDFWDTIRNNHNWNTFRKTTLQISYIGINAFWKKNNNKIKLPLSIKHGDSQVIYISKIKIASIMIYNLLYLLIKVDYHNSLNI